MPTAKKNDWFTVDKDGLAQLLERRGRAFAVLELVSNAWDQNVTTVDVTLTPTERRATYELVVTDDDPDGFADLTHAYTLFAPSTKKGEAEKRGRFNLGEKLVLALCESATISSTTGAVSFGPGGRQALRTRRPVGSEFRAIVHLTKPDFEATARLMRTLLPPSGVVTTFNAEVVPARVPVHTFRAAIATEIADEEGNLRPSTRTTTIGVYEPLADESPSIYELGIPVVDNGDRWHYDIGQKVPLNMDRDNVKPAFLRHLRTLVLNEMFNRITTEDANATWAKEASEDPRVTPEALTSVLDHRFGEKRVAYDPSDREANNIAVSQGYTLVHGGALSREAWGNIRQHDLLLPAGKVTPSNTAILREQLAAGEGGVSNVVPPERWTDGQRRLVDYARAIGQGLLGFTPTVEVVSDITLNAVAYYGSRRLALNVGRLGHRWFDSPDQHAVDALLLHEFAHERVSNHLDHEFADEIARLGAKLRDVAARL